MDKTVILSVASVRRSILAQSASKPGVALSYGAHYTLARNVGPSMLLSTTIKEEEEEDLEDRSSRSSPVTPQQSTLGSDELRSSACGEKFCSSEAGNSTDRDRGISHVAATAVGVVAAATLKLFKRITRRQHWGAVPHGAPHGQKPRCEADGCKERTVPYAAPASATTVSSSSSNAYRTKLANGSQAPRPRLAQLVLRESTSRSSAATRPQDRTPAAQRPKPPHVRLVDEDDVSLAKEALQLAAKIHDHVWNLDVSGAYGPARRAAALAVAAPLYNDAMTAAHGIRHRALHSLVKQAVRRYVNPAHGAPEDVLRVILELLTGCGAAGPARGVVGGSGAGGGSTAARDWRDGAKSEGTSPDTASDCSVESMHSCCGGDGGRSSSGTSRSASTMSSRSSPSGGSSVHGGRRSTLSRGS